MLAAIAFGSNLSSTFGDPAANLREAIERLRALGEVRAVSSFYTTEPVGYRDQPMFVNGAAVLETVLAPLDLLRAMLAIEQAMGRDRTYTPPKGPRVIDLDLLLCVGADGAAIQMHGPELALPHPAMHERRFVLESLAEIAPEWRHPVLKTSVRELLEQLISESSSSVRATHQ